MWPFAVRGVRRASTSRPPSLVTVSVETCLLASAQAASEYGTVASPRVEVGVKRHTNTAAMMPTMSAPPAQ